LQNYLLKSYWASFFIVLYILAMLRPVLPLFEYVINQDYIAEFLCVNKEKVALKCNGKCYLMQKISQQQENKKQNLPKIAIEDYPIGFVSIIKVTALKETNILSHPLPKYKNNYNFLYYNFNFHPPNLQA